jgi:uncharacterized membrane protein YcaP (DUF421 family)
VFTVAEPLHIIIRSIIFIAILFLMTKIVGKKQISEMTFFEYVSGITIGSIAAEAVMGLDNNIFHGLLGVFLFGLTALLVDYSALKSKKFRDFVEGKSTVFIKDGKILEENLKKERFSTDELAELLRIKNVFRVADVEFATLEPTGELSVLLKKENRPLTPKDLQMYVPNEKEPSTIIMDGRILNDQLARSGKNRAWLNIELQKLGVTLSNVFFAQVDAYGQLTVDLYDDKIQVPAAQDRPLVMAMLKKCQADLESFALETQSPVAKKMYQKNSQRLTEAIEKLKPYLQS